MTELLLLLLAAVHVYDSSKKQQLLQGGIIQATRAMEAARHQVKRVD
jgi:hypothetical protein